MTQTGLPESARFHARGPLTRAGGLKSLVSALSHIYRALGVRDGTLALTRINQPKGFDCPGCAWPTSQGATSRLDFCENGAKALAAEAGRQTVGPEFFRAWSIAALRAQSDQWLGQQGRLTTPMIRLDGASHYSPASYEQAYAMIAERMRALSSPDQAVFYTCGHVVNEAAFLFQLLARQFGTNNLPSSINLCHEPSGKALQAALGHSKGDARPGDELRLMTIRSHDQFNTSILDANDRYRGLLGARRAILLNATDMRRLAISPTQTVWLRVAQEARTRDAEAFRAVPYPIPEGCAAAYFPEANRLTDLDALDASTGTPASKSVRVSIAPG